MHDLISKTILPRFSNPILERLDDSAVFEMHGVKLAFTTDSYVVKPLFYPGGDIGKLAVAGTINDLAVMGARPKYLSSGLILEEGIDINVLEKVLLSMQETALSAGVMVVTGDTKVVERGNADGLFINTAGVGEIVEGYEPTEPVKGDALIINGTLGDHEATIFASREDMNIEVPVESDCAPLWSLIEQLLEKYASSIRVMRDPTRGGIAAVLNEIASSRCITIELEENKIPVKDAVMGLCEMVGFDPLYMANEGKVVLIADSNTAEGILDIMRSDPLGKDAAIIGHVSEGRKPRVILKTLLGGRRIVDLMVGAQLPRIC